jgi:predicted transcriptional regulator
MEEFDARREAMDLVTAFVGNHKLTAAELPALLTQVFNAISGFAAHEAPPKAEAVAPEPALTVTPSSTEETDPVASPTAPAPPVPVVSIEESVRNPDFIVSLITGQKLKTLKRHLRVHGLSEAEYRDRYNLPSDYPFVAPSYSETRRQVAAKMGLGRRSTPEPDAAAVSETTPSAALEVEAAAPEKPKRSKAKSARPGSVEARPKRTPKAAAPKSKSAAPANKAPAGQEPKAEALPQVMASATDEAMGAAKNAGGAESEKAAPAKSILTAAAKPGRAKRAVKEPKKPSPPRQPTAGPGARPKSAAPDNVAPQGPSKKSADRKHVTASKASSPAETSSASVEPSVDTSGVATKAKRPRRKLSPTFS